MRIGVLRKEQPRDGDKDITDEELKTALGVVLAKRKEMQSTGVLICATYGTVNDMVKQFQDGNPQAFKINGFCAGQEPLVALTMMYQLMILLQKINKENPECSPFVELASKLEEEFNASLEALVVLAGGEV